MVVMIMGWRPRAPHSSRKFKVTLKVHSLEGLENGEENGSPQIKTGNMPCVMMIKVNWKGPETGRLGHRLRGRQKRARTSEQSAKHQHGHVSVYWQEDFEHLCVLTVAKDTNFLPFNVQFNIIQVGAKSKAVVIGKAAINLGDFAPTMQEIMKHTMRLPISSSEALDKQIATLVVSLNFSEVRLHESPNTERFMPPSLHCLSGPLLCDAQIRDMYGKKIKDMRKLVSFNGKKTSGEIDSIMSTGKLFTTSEESSSEPSDPNDTDSLDDSGEDKTAHGGDQILQTYGPLSGVNLFVEGAVPQLMENWQVEDSMTLSTCSKTCSEGGANETSMSDSDRGTTMRSLLSWKKRRLSFGLKARGEPLLNKAYGEDGGDDIDRDRRLSGCPMEPCCSQSEEKAMLSSSISECLDFGEELFSVGCWERKELVSRDGNMKLSVGVFFASIDQRSERAAGESACTALVAVIADWLHKNPDCMPIKAEFDTLIREGSAEWRKLCDVEAYRNNFPDRHFDLDTVVSAKVRPLAVDHARSFVGFFQPAVEGLDDTYNVLQGAKSFDDIWIAIEEALVWKPDGSFEPAIYIVGWNDHFFILKVSKEAYYIIDTLGERLYEGCNQAYMLRFDTDAVLQHVPKPPQQEESLKSEKKSSSSESISKDDATDSEAAKACSDSCLQSQQPADNIEPGVSSSQLDQDVAEYIINSSNLENNPVEFRAKEACKEFVKGFFAALPIRELQKDMKKGLCRENTLHQRLQVEFHFTNSLNMHAYCGSDSNSSI